MQAYTYDKRLCYKLQKKLLIQTGPKTDYLQLWTKINHWPSVLLYMHQSHINIQQQQPSLIQLTGVGYMNQTKP